MTYDISEPDKPCKFTRNSFSPDSSEASDSHQPTADRHRPASAVAFTRKPLLRREMESSGAGCSHDIMHPAVIERAGDATVVLFDTDYEGYNLSSSLVLAAGLLSCVGLDGDHVLTTVPD
ncbi:hypothetical protein EYF80_020732 [Liparis tanakae]|uniref:Uncharacterized protein n=1 Tax=Liparis tanakae TaxID=230148 RepID=A0A4Z2HT98_9TELE|nr:hypothetical protein EYF80_020732 [Liparis tanakae]